jgi:arabinogalactan oligomer/maltooligosaccharide transport system permease protein
MSKTGMMHKKKKTSLKQKIVRAFIYLILILITITTILPLYYVVIAAFNPGNSLFTTKMFPDRLTTDHFHNLFVKKDYGLWYMNTLKIAFSSMVLTIILVVITSYVFSQFRVRGRKGGLMFMLIMTMFPGFMSMIAVYLMLLHVGLLDTHLGLIIVYAGGAIPGLTWLVKGYFDGIPRTIPEAAKIDGAGNGTIFFRIMLPMSFPIITFVSVSSFIGPWMDYIFARLVLRTPSKKTLAIGLFEMVTGRQNTEFTMFAAGAVLVALPITILYMSLQKYLIRGIAEGASKT